jgi:hypothetical protein
LAAKERSALLTSFSRRRKGTKASSKAENEKRYYRTRTIRSGKISAVHAPNL